MSIKLPSWQTGLNFLLDGAAFTPLASIDLYRSAALRVKSRESSSRNPRFHEELLSVPQAQPNIRFPLAPEVTSLLQKYAEQGCELTDDGTCSALSKALKNGTVIWSHFSRAVVQLDERIVVKIGSSITLTDANMTAHIRSHSSDIPVPEPLGYLGGGSPPLCIDSRMWKRESPEYIEGEGEFNEFLLSGNRRPGMEPYVEFVRPMLYNNHRIVLTHGDLHPRNIMAIKDGEGEVRVAGLVGWEVGGAYPEYWEFVKSLNTIRPIRFSDWPFFLPLEGIGIYYEEYAIDRLVDHCVT
ncbi:hypothetical protein MGYG_06068 [Nannizzia gypsea CBS 118893]|uniref:Aminoglycoside phosphotransferase domain-containing protein n=1 Tax=Arthroderma gypseum (strain ATCC MYA-4604 / CBS 118893) TaxID=535722 RepID=E4V0D3_ARTGP|nr:hypothetical protein MGYG_06068 [Nannizzia gypsea CBS 118893]EFR03070.1 hypothetical protein MGYG_06068 [Nannizzia gypsea CBS 118893]